MSEDKPEAAPGWYPHPSMTDTQRYWDGEKWTDQVAPLGPTPQPPAAAPSSSGPGAISVMVGILLAAIVIWFIYELATANDEVDCAVESAERVLDGDPPLDCDD